MRKEKERILLLYYYSIIAKQNNETRDVFTVQACAVGIFVRKTKKAYITSTYYYAAPSDRIPKRHLRKFHNIV